MKIIILAIALIATGCSSVPVVEQTAINLEKVQAAPAPEVEIIENVKEVVAAAPVPMVKSEKPFSVDITGTTPKELQPTESPINVTENIKKAVKIVKQVKTTVDEVKSIWEEKDKPSEPVPAAPENKMPDMAPPPDYRTGTGAKVSLFGVGMEFWLGNNDSWSTVLKLLVLLLVTYGGFKAINYFFDTKNKQKLAT